MARKIKITNLYSRHFALRVKVHGAEGGITWHVQDTESMASTRDSTSMDDYRTLKRTWRKSKEDFDSVCRMMDFRDLFSAAGVKL